MTNLIPKKMDNRILCRVLKEIWVSPVLHSKQLETVREEQEQEQEANGASEDTAGKVS